MLNSTQMRGASQSFRLLWIRTLQFMTTLPPQISAAMLAVMQIPESDFKGLYRWFEGLPIMRHWLGDRKFAQLRAEGFEVTSEHWESSITVKGADLKFDKLGGYRPAIQKMAQELMLWPYRRVITLMNDSFSGSLFTCFDGEALFSTAHPTGSNVSTIGSGIDFSAANLDVAKLAMRAQVDVTNADPLFIEPTHIWYHQDLATAVEDVIDVNPTTGGMGNKHFKSLEKVPFALDSTLADAWGLFSLPPGDPLKPILWQFDPAGGDFTALDQPRDQAVFMRDELLYGTDAWGAIACGFPWYAWGSDGKAS